MTKREIGCRPGCKDPNRKVYGPCDECQLADIAEINAGRELVHALEGTDMHWGIVGLVAAYRKAEREGRGR